ncbi:hypothetical protein [Vibrio parahaemolyticus]|uniref:hypothetical protein n=1 Tax=Vibrio parahaemolyticus TaxID=670 RepID=UPI00226AE709|nr:hypothetical protein [Vibrio parahaemolyticus]MCX8796443.1 hypothetical protein [Vibrio parahaemolyticus]
MKVEPVKVIIAIQNIEKEAGMMRYEAQQMLQKAEGMELAAQSLREDFKTAIEIYESSMKKLGESSLS